MIQKGTMGVASDIALVNANNLHSEGFGGWWQPLDRLIGSFQLNNTAISIATPTPWDGALGGRCETIIQMTDSLNKGKVRDFFLNCAPLRSVVGEILQPTTEGPEPYPFPLVLVSRYRDNIYILVCGVHETEYPILRCALSALLAVLYGIKLKWEPEGAEAIWGISTVTFGSSFGLRRKGAVTDLD